MWEHGSSTSLLGSSSSRLDSRLALGCAALLCGCIFPGEPPYDEVQDRASAVAVYPPSATRFRAHLRVQIDARAELRDGWNGGESPLIWVPWTIGVGVRRCADPNACDAPEAGQPPAEPWWVYLQGGPTLIQGDPLRVYARPGEALPADPECRIDTTESYAELSNRLTAECPQRGPCSRALAFDVEGHVEPASDTRQVMVNATVRTAGNPPPKHKVVIESIDIEYFTDGAPIERPAWCPASPSATDAGGSTSTADAGGP